MAFQPAAVPEASEVNTIYIVPDKATTDEGSELPEKVPSKGARAVVPL